MENKWIAVVNGRTQEYTVSHRLYSAFELTELLQRAGFGDISVYGDFEESDYDQNAERLAVVARK